MLRRNIRSNVRTLLNPVLDLFQRNLESVKSLEIARRISIVRSSVGVASFVNAAIAFLTSSVQSDARAELYSLHTRSTPSVPNISRPSLPDRLASELPSAYI